MMKLPRQIEKQKQSKNKTINKRNKLICSIFYSFKFGIKVTKLPDLGAKKCNRWKDIFIRTELNGRWSIMSRTISILG